MQLGFARVLSVRPPRGDGHTTRVEGSWRVDMILTHSHYAGQLNVPDALTRLIFSLLVVSRDEPA